MRKIILFGLFCVCLGFGQAAERFRRGYGYHPPRHYDEIESDYDGGGGDNGGGGGGYSGRRGGHSDVEGGYSGGGSGYSGGGSGYSGGGSGYGVVRGGYSGSRKEHSGSWGGYNGDETGPSGDRSIYSEDMSIYSGVGRGSGGGGGGNTGNRGGHGDVEDGYSGGGERYTGVEGGHSGGDKQHSGVRGGHSGFDRGPNSGGGVYSGDGSVYSGVGVGNSGGGGEHSSSEGGSNVRSGYEDKSGNEKYESGGEKISGSGSFRDYLKSVHDAAHELKELILGYLASQEKATGKEKEVETNSDDEDSSCTTTDSMNGGSGGNADEAVHSIDKNGGRVTSGGKKEYVGGLSDSHQSGISSEKVVEITTDSSHDISKGREGHGSGAEKGEHEDSVFSRRNGRHGGLKDAGFSEQTKHHTGFKGVFGDKSEGKNSFNGGGRFASDNHVKVHRGKGEVDAGISFGFGGGSAGRVVDRKGVGLKGGKPGIYCGAMGCYGFGRDEETGLEKSRGFGGEGSEERKNI